MKLLVAGDTHGHTPHIEKLVATAKDNGCMAIFQVGDFGYWEHVPDGKIFLDDVEKIVAREEVPLYFLGGNHDNDEFLLKKYHLEDNLGFIEIRHNLFYCKRGLRWTWDSAQFAAFGGAYSVDKNARLQLERERSMAIAKKNQYRLPSDQKSTNTSGTYWFPGEEMTDQDMDGFLEDTSPVDVIFAHDKPRASNPRWNRKDYLECYPNQDRLQKAMNTLKPQKYIHGHLHYPYSDLVPTGYNQYTWVFGLGCDPYAWEQHMGPYKFTDSYLILNTKDLNEGKS